MSKTYPVVLSVAGSDSSGGAGIQADIKTATALGVYAETAITALTAQNTQGVRGVVATEPAFVTAQIDACFDDIPPAAVKIGMIPSPGVAHAVAETLIARRARNIVLDPVMVATSGAALSDDNAIGVLAGELFAHAAVITPNIPEATVLAGQDIATAADMQNVAEALCRRFGCAVLVKGGHAVSDASDVLAMPDGDDTLITWFNGPRIDTENTHGTGCTLSTAIACGLAQGLPLVAAIQEAKRYLTGALAAGLALGHGNGPVDHMWRSTQ